MVRIRNGITVVAFVAFTIVASLAALRTIRAGIPETSTSSGAALFIEHLCEIDLSKADARDRRHMGHRVMRELRDDVDWQEDVAALSDAQKQRLLDNLTELAQSIIEDKINVYHNLPDREKRRFINRQIEEVMRWAVTLDRVTQAPGANTVRMAAMMTLMARLNQWYSKQSPEMRDKTQAFQKAFQEQMAERFKRGMQPNPN